MSEKIIKSDNDVTEKFLTYADLLNQYNISMENDFYFEAMLIADAMLEDRLSSYLYYLGCLKGKNSDKFKNNEVRKIINTLAEKYCTKNERDNLDIADISGKRNVILATLKWAKSGYEECEDDYLYTLKEIYDKISIDEVLKNILKAEEWCDCRNELFKAMINKNLEILYEMMSDKAVDGMKLSRFFDSIVKKLKSQNEIKKARSLD